MRLAESNDHIMITRLVSMGSGSALENQRCLQQLLKWRLFDGDNAISELAAPAISDHLLMSS